MGHGTDNQPPRTAPQNSPLRLYLSEQPIEVVFTSTGPQNSPPEQTPKAAPQNSPLRLYLSEQPIEVVFTSTAPQNSPPEQPPRTAQ